MAKRTRKVRLSYGEGDLFAIPMEELGWTIGLIGRGRQPSRGETILFVYIFDHVSSSRPASCTKRLTLKDAVAGFRCGSQGLTSGEWPVVGRMEPFIRSEWPLPSMISAVGSVMGARLITYNEDELDGEPLSVRRIHEQKFRGPRSTLSGHLAAQIGAEMAILATRRGECRKGEFEWHLPSGQ